MQAYAERPKHQGGRPRPETDPEAAAAAEAAGLRYVTDSMPGITRRRAGKGFTYRDPQGRVITERKELARLRRLAIPPAWTAVWICPHPRGHLQATDAMRAGASSTATTRVAADPRCPQVRPDPGVRAGIAADPGARGC